MLRINLLPPYIYDKQKKIKWIVGSLALIPITLVLMLMWAQQAQAALDKENARKAEATTQQNQYNQYVQNIKKEQDAVAATKAKQTFVSNALMYNAAWPQTYGTMRDLTSPRVLLKSLYVTDDRKGLNFTGWCQKEEDLIRWWMFLRQQGDVFTDVHFALPQHPYQPVAANTNNATGGPGGMMGGPPMMPGMPGSGGMAGSGGMMRGGGMSMMMPGMGGSGGPGAFGGASFGGGGGNSEAVGEEEIEGRKGIKFSATATLKKPLANGIPTPTWATAGGNSGGGGGSSPMGMSSMGMSMPGMSGGAGTTSPPGGKKGGDF